MFFISKYGFFGIVFMMMMVMSSSKISFSSDINPAELVKTEFFKPVINKLIERGVDSNFINKIINHPNTEFNERFVKINVIGYLNKADYSSHYNSRSVLKSTTFLNENRELLELAELKYGVPKEVITSVLWVETRHGDYLGNSHVASVYLSTAMCNEKVFMDMNIKNLRNQFKGSKEDLLELEEKIYARSNKKAEWALDQIIALEKIDANLHLEALELKGSWAGAFGISQFIPTSYLSWAVDGNGDGVVNLFNLPDAVFSVANYLKSNGWGNADNEQRNAVFHYNNSSAYVDAVLKLASLIKPVEVEHEVIEKISPVETKMQAQSGGDPK